MGPRQTGHACTCSEQAWHMERWPQGSTATSSGFAMQMTHQALEPPAPLLDMALLVMALSGEDDAPDAADPGELAPGVSACCKPGDGLTAVPQSTLLGRSAAAAPAVPPATGVGMEGDAAGSRNAAGSSPPAEEAEAGGTGTPQSRGAGAAATLCQESGADTVVAVVVAVSQARGAGAAAAGAALLASRGHVLGML